MMIELKHCPFCGEAARLLEYPFGDIITCDNVRCPATVSISREHAFRDHQEQNLLIEAWNTRTEMTCRDESGGDPCAFVCSHCGSVRNHPEDEPIAYCPNCGAKVVNE